MINPERKIFVPLGDKTHEKLERAASYEAWDLVQGIIREEESKGRIVIGGTESLQKLPWVNPISHLKKGIIALGGYLVTIKEREKPRKDFRPRKSSS
ncbi:hypothetical protein AMJ51_02385 [Microgenomates bacterium DG_75]|nr:MAG: hypothetical protein AMJ51_02385 [Microgenomates bacterium DG_75]